MQNNSIKKFRSSAIVYALIVSFFAGVLMLVVSTSILLSSTTSSQIIDGIQAQYSSESALELGYVLRRTGTTITDSYPPNADPGSANMARSEITINENLGIDSMTFGVVNSENTPVRRNLETTTMEFKVYADIDETNPGSIGTRNFTFMANGYHGSSQYNLKAFVGAANDPLLPYIFSSIAP
ncbi:hypothetical protein ACFL14_01985 [Patescibacteria group bacterium]